MLYELSGHFQTPRFLWYCTESTSIYRHQNI